VLYGEFECSFFTITLYYFKVHESSTYFNKMMIVLTIKGFKKYILTIKVNAFKMIYISAIKSLYKATQS